MTEKTRHGARDDDVCEIGEVAPGGDERRRRIRSATSIKATVRTGQSEQLVTIENISEQGLGVADIAVDDEGDDVIVALEDGRNL